MVPVIDLPVTPDELTLTVAFADHPGTGVSLKTVLAEKSAAIPVNELESWYTDFISFVSYCLTAVIDLLNSSFSLIKILSPTRNVPEVCDNLRAVVPLAATCKYPVASLLTPRTNVPIGAWLAFNDTPIVNVVYVWTSNRYKSHSLAEFWYGVFLSPNEYTLATPISVPDADVGNADCFTSLCNLTKLVALFKPTKGVPLTLSTLIKEPSS